MKTIFKNTIIRNGVIALIALSVLAVILEPNIHIAKMMSRYAFQIMFGLLGLGMLFFILGQRRLMFSSLLSCAALCVYLMENTNPALRFDQQNQETQFSVAHYTVSNFGFPYKEAIQHIKSVDADIVSIQELTPDWAEVLEEGLSDQYAYHTSVIRIDPYGQSLFSKFPLPEMDTVFYNQIPHLAAQIAIENHHLSLISSYTLPPVDKFSFEKMNAQFGVLSQVIAMMDPPVVVLGEFNVPPWSKEILDFKYQNDLKTSRRGSIPANFSYPFGASATPMEHILYSRDIECIDFKRLFDSEDRPIGIMGRYQFIKKRINTQKGG